MSARLWTVVAGAVALAISGPLLGLWASGDPDLMKIAAWRCKTNTCVALVLGATALVLRTSDRRSSIRLSHALAIAMTAIGALTMLEYTGIDLGIDQLLAQDWPFTESVLHPNRMSPNAAISFVLLGLVLVLSACRPRWAAVGQILALGVIMIDGGALIGYLYDAAFLYRTGTFVRLSPYTALCFVVLAAGSFALRPEVGIVRRFRGDGIGAYLARRFVLPVVVIPIALGWLRVEGESLDWWGETTGSAVQVISYIFVFAAFVLYVARSLDTIDARRKASEQELRQAHDIARAANRAKDEFLAMLGHELRNPLAPIGSALALMRLRDPGPNHEREVIERQVQHMTRLVGDLLDVSRIAGGKIELDRTRVDIHQVIDEAMELVRPLIEDRRHEVSVEVADELAVEGDRARLVQIVSNLLNNAAKYTPPGGAIQVVASRDADNVVLKITDNGVGISPALLPQVFERFVQGTRSLDRMMGGLGVGLAIVRSLVALHAGTVAAASDGDGKGATFTVTLPLATTAAVEPSAPMPPPAAAAEARRILIVDDNQDAAELLAEVFQLAGHTVRVAHDGVRALEVDAEFDPECVMLDIGLPLLDGYEVARRLRQRDGARRRVLVAMTGYGQAEDVRRALEAGFDRHLVKPVSLAVTLQIIASSPGHPT
jgi:signal transduction histidine kinase